MIFIRRLAGALCLAFCFSAYSNAQEIVGGQLDPTQVYNTPNLVIPTIQGSNSTPWVNGVYQDSLTCWAWGNPGYCGPNAIVRPGDNINFSFGYTDLYQSQAISNVLPSSGTGLRVNGYNFSFLAKNGNGWDDGRVDYLSAYVHFTNKAGQVIENDTYNLTYQYDWTAFNLSKNFIAPYSSSTLGNVTYGFVGQDNNFWAGPYGPEIYNISFSLKYSVDPCYVNVLSSPSCPGYFEALAKLTSPVAPSSTTVEISPTLTATISETSAPVIEPVTQTASSSAIAPVTSTPSASKTPITTTSSSQVSSTEKSVSGTSLNTILGIVRRELSRISGVESSTVSQANESASQAASQAQQQAEAIAGTAATNSLTFSSNNSSGSGLGVSLASVQSFSSLNNNPTLSGPGQGLRPQIQLQSVERDTSSVDNFNSSSDFSVRSLIKDYLDEKPKITNDGQPQGQRQPGVKKNVRDNEAAGEVNIALIATQPVGFDIYMSAALKDSAFYAPKEIYKNQKVIDNQRILRQLSGRSDRLHEEMVDDQYKNR